ncbi:phage tail family protein [Niallia taxi]|uniref:phage tail family protein n=1 Tax=Niallia taxi TaxID=2499688 RepID=UPI0015F5E893|nr:phage tail family protein [Niallia taxi]
MLKKQLYIDRNGIRQSLEEVLGCRFLELIVSSPQPSTNYQQQSGLDGQLDGYTTYGPKTVTANFFLKSTDIEEYQLLIRDVWQFFYSREAYYISSSDMLGIRYLVHPKPMDFTRVNPVAATFPIEFEVFKGYGESWATTLNDFTFEEEKWQIGMNLPLAEDVNYIFANQRNFDVYNASDIVINPLLRHELSIAISGIGSSVKLVNKSTNDVFQYNKSMKQGDVLVLTGVYPLMNNEHCGRDTNHGIITLAPLIYNEFELTGLRNSKISFDFPFLYVNK